MQRVLQRFNVSTFQRIHRSNVSTRPVGSPTGAVAARRPVSSLRFKTNHWLDNQLLPRTSWRFNVSIGSPTGAVAALRPNGSLHFERFYSAHQPAVAARRPGGARELPGRPADRPIPELRAGGGAGLHHHTCSTSENSTCSSTQRQRHQRHHQAPAPTPFVKHGLRATEMKSLPRLCCDQLLRRQNIACDCIQWP